MAHEGRGPTSGGMTHQSAIDLSSDDRARLEAVVADRNAPQKHAWRARIVLLAAEGLSVRAVARRTGKAQPTVPRWRRRFGGSRRRASTACCATGPGRRAPRPCRRRRSSGCWS